MGQEVRDPAHEADPQKKSGEPGECGNGGCHDEHGERRVKRAATSAPAHSPTYDADHARTGVRSHPTTTSR